MRKIEVLAPAGNFETMQAAIRAGADAVYLGGSQFGARAYAGNLDQEELFRAIDYVHLHGKHLYLTVNTLLKERELEEGLDAYLEPLYRQGLDAVIVQDLGVFSYIRERFPDLAVHASTQMTMTGPQGSRLLEQLGATRVVTARELSLEEIRKIRQVCDLEIESFVHGALCYCYSGQCLMSSLIGGRSGNRGRCAQPCRMNYQAWDGDRLVSRKKEPHLLSPKDMNTVAILPEIIEAGVTSLKIEGRMKKPVYTAGVTEIYRRALDRYLEFGKEGFYVREEEQKQLFDLFQRNGFHQSYYKEYNGKDMMALEEKEFRFGNEALAKRLEDAYLKTEKKEPIRMHVTAKAGEPLSLRVQLCDGRAESFVQKEVPEPASNRAAVEEDIRKQMDRLGGTMFAAQEIKVDLQGELFLPVSKLNELRREALDALQESVCGAYRREMTAERTPEPEKWQGTAGETCWTALCVNEEQFQTVLQDSRIRRIYLESDAADAAGLQADVARCRKQNKEFYLALPYVLRDRSEKRLKKLLSEWKGDLPDGILVRSIEELVWMRELFAEKSVKLQADAGLYSWNRRSRAFLQSAGADADTLPLELNQRELAERGAEGSELVIYGRAPMMVSVQCVRRNTTGCHPVGGTMELEDRLGNHFPIRFACRDCYNVIYNSAPLSLFGLEKQVQKLRAASWRLSFSTETAAEVKEILQTCMREDPVSFTRGHWKRGVE